MNTISRSIKSRSQIPLCNEIISSLEKNQKFTQDRQPGSSNSWLIADLANYSNCPLVIFVADSLESDNLYNEILIFSPSLLVYQFPDWEILPYDRFSPNLELISERLNILYNLTRQNIDILIISIMSAMQRLPPPTFLSEYAFSFKIKDKLDKEGLLTQLTSVNYKHVTQVTMPGEFCIRGGLIDLFPMGSDQPYRLDLFDNEIESIYNFDVNTQRRLHRVEKVRLLPSREFPTDRDTRKFFCMQFRKAFKENLIYKTGPYNDVKKGIFSNGIEFYLPLFFEHTSTLFDYLQKNTICITLGNVDYTICNYTQTISDRYNFLKNDQERPILDPEKLFINRNAFYSNIEKFSYLTITNKECSSDFFSLPDITIKKQAEDPISKLRTLLTKENGKILLCVNSLGRKKILYKMFNDLGLISDIQASSFNEFIINNGHFGILVASLRNGFSFPKLGLILITENDLYKTKSDQIQYHKNMKGYRNKNTLSDKFQDLSDLQTGDPVVHIQHGIGRYHGLINMNICNSESEFMHLRYANDTSLYVPISQFNMITRYGGINFDNVPFHELGSNQWDKAKRKARKKAQDTAAELLEIYSKRVGQEGYSFKIPLNDYEFFSKEFGFEETTDQSTAIEAVLTDMQSIYPMDRLICGDVGFGKTEIALRAAFIATYNKKQVALLCPTTLLTEQHTQNFSDRFASWPINIINLSRFRSRKEIDYAIKSIKNGTIDIVIGTHKILSDCIDFKNLGLIIIDEEHRFGVLQKEKLKKNLGNINVDTLTLTATPIPRTLSMSLEGIRDFSIIATPPQNRLPIRTLVRREDHSIIREAIQRELKRGGQVYFIHNEIKTIHNRYLYLSKLVPEANITIAHGQMPERELEQVVKNFYQKRSNLLLSTTIMETGIDIPKANTIIIHRSDRFGLAQLHQLRGRVGRSYQQAYAYLMIPDEDVMTNDAKKRLQAIQNMSELGSGFHLSIQDLEIRGNGEIFGSSQSGNNMQEIGFNMYSVIIKEALNNLKGIEKTNSEISEKPTCSINLHEPMLLPKEYCNNIPARLSIYKRLALIKNYDEIFKISEELIDRFGKLPDPVKNLLEIHKLRLFIEPFNITKVDCNETRILLQFNSDSKIDLSKIVQLMQCKKNIKFLGQDKLQIDINLPLVKDRIKTICEILHFIEIK